MDATSDLPAALRDDRKHVFHSWSAQRNLAPLLITRAEGSRFWDDDGREYLDFTSQLVNLNLGHQHPRLVSAIKQQAERICTIAPSVASDVRSEAARLIASHAPDGMNRVFFTNGGAEAVEYATRMARTHTGRSKVLSAYRSYHGSTAGAISLTGEWRRLANEPGVPGAVKFWGPYLYRSPFNSTSPDQERERALAHLERTLIAEGPEHVAAVLVETVVGTNGVLPPPDGYLAGVRALCDEHGVLLICDEVMAGFGRCAEWFAVDRWNVRPDLIAFAKGVNSGYVPLGGVLIADHVAASFDDVAFAGGLTYSGHPLACAVAAESVRVFEDEHILEHVRSLDTDVIAPTLHSLHEDHPSIGEVRGLGVFWAIEFVTNRAQRTAADSAAMSALAAALRQRGVWPMVVENRLHIVPPCTMRAETLQDGLARISEAIGATTDLMV